MHRRIDRAIKARDVDRARAEMSQHLDRAYQAQAGEEKRKRADRAARASRR